MNIQRDIVIMINYLQNEKLKLEGDFESLMELSLESDIKTKKVKKILKNMVINESSLTKFNSMLQTNNNELKNE